jgi:hypothetical protein
MSTPVLSPLVAGLCDDAAVFPPGLTPLSDAVVAHVARREEWYADLVGPLVVPDTALGELGRLLTPGSNVALSVTLPGGPEMLPRVLASAAALPVELRAVEVPVAGCEHPVAAVRALAENAGGLDVYVEIPRNDHRTAVLAEVARRGLRAKFRTGGVRAELYPDENELADSLAGAIEAGVAFKATAGLHHAVRNTDPRTGFEQHGFLNLMAASVALQTGDGDARSILASRDGQSLAARLRELCPHQIAALRSAFTSYGTCSITEPLGELLELGLVTAANQQGASE